jgi:hypothetical protein
VGIHASMPTRLRPLDARTPAHRYTRLYPSEPPCPHVGMHAYMSRRLPTHLYTSMPLCLRISTPPCLQTFTASRPPCHYARMRRHRPLPSRLYTSMLPDLNTSIPARLHIDLRVSMPSWPKTSRPLCPHAYTWASMPLCLRGKRAVMKDINSDLASCDNDID